MTLVNARTSARLAGLTLLSVAIYAPLIFLIELLIILLGVTTGLFAAVLALYGLGGLVLFGPKYRDVGTYWSDFVTRSTSGGKNRTFVDGKMAAGGVCSGLMACKNC